MPDRSELTPEAMNAIRDRYGNPDIRPSARIAQGDVLALVAEIHRLHAKVAMHEDCILAGAKLLFDDEDWGPEPEGAGQSYRNYLSEGYHEAATEIRGGRRG